MPRNSLLDRGDLSTRNVTSVGIGICIVGFNITLDTLYVILETILRVR